MRAHRRHGGSQAEELAADREPLLPDADDEAAPLLPRTLMWGLLLYALSTVFGASTSVIVKLLGGVGGMPAMQLVFVRSCVLVACTAPHLRHAAARQLIADRHDLLLVRGCLGFMSVAFMYIAVRLLPLSDAVALAFLAPLLVAVLSPVLLNERLPRVALVALLLAAGGALLVAHPASLAALLPGGQGSAGAAGMAAAGTAPSKLGAAAALLHAFSAAGAKITVRSLGVGSTSRHVTGAIVLSAGLVSALGAGAVGLLQRSFVLPQQPAHWALLASVGLAGYLHQATMTAGLQRVPVATASSLTYLSIFWSVLADWLIFRQLPAPASLAGAAAICLGGLLVTAARFRSGLVGAAGEGGSAAGDASPLAGGQKRQLAVLRM